MALTLSHSAKNIKGEIHLTSSKSESNRALIIQALCSKEFEIDNLSISNDTIVLQELLNKSLQDLVDRSAEKNNDGVTENDLRTLSVNLAGTAMRFLTAFLAIQNKEVILTGAPRMKERPIKVLVDVLKQMGAEIAYEENEGYPPLRITGKKLVGEKVLIDGGISSQYISALLMIAPKLDKGLTITFKGEIISKPYIDMTIEMMRYFGAEVQWLANSIVVRSGEYKTKFFKVEADWSAASYWYSIVALSKEADITLYGLKQESLQGDSVVQEIYADFGVTTEFIEGGIRLTKSPKINHQSLLINFKDCPDIAQTVAVTCAALNIKATLTGLKTLRIKETDRIAALHTELTKCGFSVDVKADDLVINRLSRAGGNLMNDAKVAIETYDDHRMAMAFAPLAFHNSITIMDETVVAKSYPNFWKDLETVGFEI